MSKRLNQRKPWATPVLKRIEAGSAEGGVGSLGDGGGGASKRS